MRACPSCKATVSATETRCVACGVGLIPTSPGGEVMELGDTMRQSKSSVMAAVSSPTPVTATPGAVVRKNVTPAGRGSSPGAQTATAADPSFDSIVGARLSERYEVTRKIGEGGMGAVYEARHSLIGKRVAIKVLLDKFVEKPDIVARLQQEARLASSIGHENIIDITDFGTTDDGRTFVVMEFLDGESLAQVIEREGALAPQRAIGIVRQVASALGAAHGKGVVHRDVKPENVFITQRGEKDFVKVVDFGISKDMKPDDGEGVSGMSPRLTQTGVVLGTPLYMSPEQARGEDDLDHRIDIYALGVILYETLTGEVPFHGTNYLNIISQVLSAEPPPPSQVRPDLGISSALENIVFRAMAKDRGRRYQSMVELDADLAKIESGGAVRAFASSVPAAARSRKKLIQLIVWAGAVAAVVIALTVVLPKVLGGDSPTKVSDLPKEPPPPAAPPASSAFRMVKIKVTSDPPGAHIWLDSVDRGLAPQDLNVPYGPDKITLTLRLEGHLDATAPFFPTEDQPLAVTLTPIPPEPPPVKVDSKSVIKKTNVVKVTPGVKTSSSNTTPGKNPELDKTGGDIQKNPYLKKPVPAPAN